MSALCVNAYFRYAPDFCHEFVSLRRRLGYGVRLCLVVCNGCAVSYKAISLGIEYRFGSTKMNLLSMDPDDWGYDDMEDIGGVGDVIGEVFSSAEKTKYKLKDLRLYLSSVSKIYSNKKRCTPCWCSAFYYSDRFLFQERYGDPRGGASKILLQSVIIFVV